MKKPIDCAKEFILLFYKTLCHVFPVNKKIIIFESNTGRNYSGSPKAVYEEMTAQGLDKKYKCVWILKNINTTIPGEALKIKHKTFKFFYYMSVAGIWVSDSRLPKYIVKKGEVKYIQTWHGTPLKKLALDMTNIDMAGNKNIDRYHRNFIRDTRTWDYLVSQNNFSTNIFRRCFDFHKDMLEIGYPRNDVLINCNTSEYIGKLKTELGLPNDKKVILYAPTWRDNQYYKPGVYKFASAIDFGYLKENLSDDYVMIVKYHYLVKENIDWSKYEDFIYQYGEDKDIAQLYLVSDMMITDYSSVMFDYSILKRPMIFFTYDLEDYKDNLRGFYFDFLEEAPGPVVLTNEELLASIKNYDYDEFADKYSAFHDKFNHCDDGKASQKIVDLIVNQ